MARSHIITGLDIGTNSIKILVAEKRGEEWNVITESQIASFGLRRGSVVNIETTARNIQLLLAKAEKDAGRKIDSVFVNIGGSHLYTTTSDGLISVSRADHVISQEDIDRVLQATRAINIPLNEEILDVFPREFIVDGQKDIKQPLGLVGVRLEARVVLLCYFQAYFMNLTQAVLSAKLQIDDVIPSPLASARAVLTPQQKEIGVALLDVGSATTSLAVFEEGDLVHLAVLPLGSDNITNDLAIGLKTEVSIAEDIKKKYGTCDLAKNEKDTNVDLSRSLTDKKKNTSRDMIEDLGGKDPLEPTYPSFTKKDLVRIIEPRVSELLDLMQKELKKIGRQELLPGGIVLTGGGVKLPKFAELVREQLKLPCRIGVPKGIIGLSDDPAFSTVAGLVLTGIDFENTEEGGGFAFGNFGKGLGAKIKKMLRLFIP